MLESGESDGEPLCYEFIQAKLIEVILPEQGETKTYIFETEIERGIFNQFFLKYTLKENFADPIFEKFSIMQLEASTEEKKIYSQDRWDIIFYKEFGMKRSNLAIENAKIIGPVTVIYPLELNWNGLLIKDFEDFKKSIFIPRGTNDLYFGAFKEKFRYRFVFHIDKPVEKDRKSTRLNSSH